MDKKSVRKIVQNLVKLLISVIFILLILYFVNINSIVKTLSNFDLIYLIILGFIYIIGIAARTDRWKQIIGQSQDIQRKIVFRGLVFGYMINNLIPAKIGELARAEYLKQKTGGSRSFYLGTVIVERLLDIFVVILLFVVSVILNDKCLELLRKNLYLFLLILGGLSLLLIFFLSEKKKYMIFFPSRIRDRIQKIITSASLAFSFLKEKRLLLKILVLTILIWSLTLLSMIIILRGLNIHIPYYAYFFVISAGVFGMVIPSTSGSIGVYHAITTAALILFNVPAEKAVSYSIIAHAFDFFPNIILGIILMLNEDIKLRSLVRIN